MYANKGLLLILCLILLITPLEIHLLDEIRMSKGISQGVLMSALSKELQIGNQKGSGVTFLGEFDLSTRLDMVFLSPSRKTKTSINGNNKPVPQCMIDRKWSRWKAKKVLVVYPFDGEGFSAVLHIFPAFDFVAACRDLGCQVHRSMWANWVEPGKSMVLVLVSKGLTFALNLFGDDRDVMADGVQFDAFAK